jgi:hypothetical protein
MIRTEVTEAICTRQLRRLLSTMDLLEVEGIISNLRRELVASTLRRFTGLWLDGDVSRPSHRN